MGYFDTASGQSPVSCGLRMMSHYVASKQTMEFECLIEAYVELIGCIISK